MLFNLPDHDTLYQALIDRDATAGQSFPIRFLRRLLFRLHAMHYWFWRRALASPTHISSIDVFTYEIKMLARASSDHKGI